VGVTVLLPDLLLEDGRFVAGRAVLVDDASGRIRDVVDAAVELPAGARRVALPGRALLPGFVNAHSHSFQRLIRGRTHWRPAAENADFWTWREAMYEAALRLSPEQLHDVAHFCFIEMLRAGYTTVGEFHYLQMDPAGKPYADPNELARAVIAAARSAGIRIVLLNSCYVTGGIGEPLRPEQRRFATPELDGYLTATDALRTAAAEWPGVTVGVAPHSVRAVPADWLEPIAAWAEERDTPFHMHVSEQPAEVEACTAAYGVRPVELLAREGVLGPRLTAVHATHLTENEIVLLGGANATVCACPTTERDLGDGILHAGALTAAGARVAVGTDSQTIIEPLEEIRLVEYHERLRSQRRIIVTDLRGDRRETAPALLRIGTEHGARALGVQAGALLAGLAADFVAVDLEHRSLAGTDAEGLAAMLALSGHPDVVTDAWVGGRRVVEDRVHPLEPEATAAFRTVAAQ
jgi:formimidoylglutamate deiminase